MATDRSNTRFFWFMLIVLGLVIYVGIMWATTADDCGPLRQKYWQYFPPHWVCTRP